MVYHRITSFKRALCFPYMLRHRLLSLIVPSSFIAICVFLFLKIQHFGDKSSPVFIPKTPEAKLWDDIIKSGVTISNPELFKRAVLMMRGDNLNSSARLIRHKSLQQNNENSLENKSFEQLNNNRGQNHENISSVSENASVVLQSQLRQHPENANIDLKQKMQPIFAVILVISRPNNVLLRLAARKTWARDIEMYRFLVRFVVGRQEDWSDIIDRESSMHNDVIIFEDDDVEEVLPSKVIKGFEWVVASQIVGSVRENVAVIRDLQNNKWAVSMLDYPSPKYPTYVFGGGYVMRAQTAKVLLENRYLTYSWVHLEDVYLTGFVAAKSGISHKHHIGFSDWDSQKVNACDFVMDRRINSINNTEQDFYELFKGIQFLLRSKNKNYCN